MSSQVEMNQKKRAVLSERFVVARQDSTISKLRTANTSYTLTVTVVGLGTSQSWSSSNSATLVSSGPILPASEAGANISTKLASWDMQDVMDFVIAARRRHEPDGLSHEELKKKYGL